MNCPRCQTDNPPEAKFCGKCGAPLETAPPPAPPQPPPPPTQPVVTDALKWGVVAGSVLVPLVGIIMGLIYLNDANPEKKKVGKLWLLVGIGAIVVGCICYLVMVAIAGAQGGF